MRMIFGTVFCALTVIAAIPALAGNTIIRVGLAADNPNEVIQGVTVSTTRIDSIFNSVGISGSPTGDLTDDLFQELNESITEIEVAIRNGLLSTNEITQVYYVNLDPDPARLTLSQTSTGVGAKIGEIDGQIGIRVQSGIPLCGSYRIDADINNFRVEADYDVWNGTIENAEINYDVGRVDIGSLSIFGGLCRVFAETVLFGQSARSEILDLLQNETDNLVMEAQMTELFSLRDIVQDFRTFVTTIDAPNFNFAQHNLSVIAEDARDDAIEALDHIVSVLDQESFQGTGLNVTLELKPQSPNNILNLIVSHNPSDIAAFEVENGCATFSVFLGERTAYGTLFKKPFGSGYWNEEKQVYGWGQDFIGNVSPGDQFIVIGKSNLFGNLYSRPDIDNIVTYTTHSGYLPSIYETFCDGEGLPGGGGFGGSPLQLPG